MDDSIEELESFGMVRTVNFLGTAPYSYGDVTPTYDLYPHFKDRGLNYDPEEDIKVVASAIASYEYTDGNRLVKITGMSPLRINRAVAYLEDHGIVKTMHEMGSAPFDFGFIWSTGETRRFVEK